MTLDRGHILLEIGIEVGGRFNGYYIYIYIYIYI